MPGGANSIFVVHIFIPQVSQKMYQYLSDAQSILSCSKEKLPCAITASRSISPKRRPPSLHYQIQIMQSQNIKSMVEGCKMSFLLFNSMSRLTSSEAIHPLASKSDLVIHHML